MHFTCRARRFAATRDRFVDGRAVVIAKDLTVITVPLLGDLLFRKLAAHFETVLLRGTLYFIGVPYNTLPSELCLNSFEEKINKEL